MYTFANFILPNARRAPRARNIQQDEASTGFLAAGRRTLLSLLYDGNDDWQSQYGSNDRILARDENQPYLALLGDDVENEVATFILGPYLASDTRERQVKLVQSLITGDTSKSPTERHNVPTIWMWDWNCRPDRSRLNGVLGQLSFGKQLSIQEFSELLRKPRLLEAHGGTSSPLVPRRIYINNPGGDEILELIRQLPASQAEGFRELLAKYIDNSPRPYFGVREFTAWKSFSLLFNCPSYALATEDAEDNRTVSNGGSPANMRSRDSLDFLYPSCCQKDNCRNKNTELQGEPRYKFIHEVVSSALITGQSENYWTAFFFNEDLFQEPQKQRLQADAELDEDGGTTDPITMTEETAATFQHPRVYGLQTLVSQLNTILEHQWAIERCFRESLDAFTKAQDIDSKQLRKWGKSFNNTLKKVTACNWRLLERFDRFIFEEDVRFGPDGNPHGRLFQSLKQDPIAMAALHKLVEISRDLKSVNQDLELLMKAYDDFRRGRKDDKAEEEISRFDQEQKLQQLIKSIAALQIVLTLMSLAAQLFDAWNPSYPVPFIIVVVITVIICIVALVYFCWRRPVSRRRQDASRSEVDEELGCIGAGRDKQKRS